MLDFYQHIPEHINPIVFSIGDFAIHWYSIMWVTAFGVIYLLLLWRTKKNEGNYSIEFLQNLITNSLIGALVGGRLGYVIFYNLLYYIKNPIQVISPYDFDSDRWIGIYGMSYHGGVIGVVIALIWTAKKNKQDVLKLFDFIVPVIPLGYMFGRFGNFFNTELVGRITDSSLGMYFNDEIVLRHPSQLYEAFCEGVLLFIILWSLRNRKFEKGILGALYLMGYAIVRFIIEFFREPDEQLGFVFGTFTMGQILSFIMFIIGIGLFIKIKNRRL